VEPRDFARPIRLSPRELDGIEARLAKRLPEVAAGLERALRGKHALRLVEVSEVGCEGLFDALGGPLAALRFEVAGQPGWLVWDLLPALAEVEVALGSGEPEVSAPRSLSSVERKVMQRLLSPVVEATVEALGLKPASLAVARDPGELGSWRDGGERADRRRLCVHLALDGPGGPRVLRVYVPGVDPRRGASKRPAPALPTHLEQVKVELSARLGASDVPLAELLELEPGDVIPLGVEVGGLLTVQVENRRCASAHWGLKDGRVVLRLQELDLEFDEEC
jgi:flagellar motor switch/type III secretory pathway protein FliN